MNETSKQRQWIDNNTTNIQGWSVEVIGNYQESLYIPHIIDIKEGMSEEEKLKTEQQNIKELIKGVESLIQYTNKQIVDQSNNETFNNEIKNLINKFNSIIRHQFNQINECQIELIQKRIQNNIMRMKTKMEDEIKKYSDAISSVEKLVKISTVEPTMNVVEQFNNTYVLWKPMTEKIAFSYTERYGVLDESQKTLSCALDNWEKEISLRGYLIQAVHTGSEKRITGIFEGHEEQILHLKFDIGLLLRLILCLSKSLSYDGDKRINIIIKCLNKIILDKKEIDSVALQVFNSVKLEIKQNIEKSQLQNTEITLQLLNSLEELIASMHIKEIPKHIDGFWVEVNHIPFNAQTDVVVGLFKKIGVIMNDVKIINGKCRIQYKNLNDALNACKLDNRAIKNTTSILSVRLLQ
ncbi:hypothetical protein EHI8A_022910 [Entamoeba histolytica HM-1:IMSS-B]|uniref:RRM domain-containing protein n=6 Tax=Entamoeba histolytica TaxID=5759 RepID=C4M439_ENTH1|nr:hypothetical protein EHI_030050 [Entamoeba histolytica HM-1:IMSS]EMD44932.1 Hypothetical protein EHI5A_034890 [Entamoeba histolytica KU27]EMH76706.1 hypothetical protein EHI8A_022910 [Entamoeba histolytica HM-1:IMSS-B]EMS11547.1 hypothetical protein KM1_055640 [Entamoeba histolytica HM-3:IMSS]ENY62813.1 hypothetical protein EHI7A_026030 [Entamoeba histolytica HM-1:IMSS-A]GAT96113.1 hypothetical protein CL6EHI_030050 [Entamoeba histolytica]|eukprot:XP_653774.1 hypothetical protein EHI_030050 [Entamoeba histolytica HM-1:IMSS]